jgi:DNA-binding NtrC family response regulator
MKKPNLLIVDDNKAFTNSAAFVLTDFNVIKAYSPDEVRKKIHPEIDLILLDLVFNEQKPDIKEGLDFIPFLKKNYPDSKIVILTNYPTIETTVSAIKAGATDYLNKKELNWKEWKNRLLNYAKTSIQIRELKERNLELEQITDDNNIIGTSSAAEFLRLRLKDLAYNSSDAVIFLTGETGTGKNHAARYFRKHSRRCKMPFREFSILELSETLVESELFGHVKGAFTGASQNKKGLFEQAEGGILFLDEIGDYDLKIQTKILRFIDEKVITPVGSGKSKKLDLQLILASNQEIPPLIKEKKFREDLYQRINRIRIELPPLRERKEDIPLFAQSFFQHFKVKEKTKLISIDPDAMEVLSSYSWPGNIRELQSVIWDACTKARLFGDTVLQIKHLKKEITEPENRQPSGLDAKPITENQQKIVLLEMESIDVALKKSYGQKAVAAKILGINADQLRYKVLKLTKEYPELCKQFIHLIKAYKI